MSGRRQIVLRIFPSQRNPFHQKVRERVAALQRELGVTESAAAMHLLLHQVLDDTEKKVAGLVPTREPSGARDTQSATRGMEPQGGQAALQATTSSVIQESDVDRPLDDSGARPKVAESTFPLLHTQAPEDSLSRRSRWSSFSRTSKSSLSD